MGKLGQMVGVVRQVHHYGLDKAPEPTIYAPFEQMADKAMVWRCAPRPIPDLSCRR